MKKRATRDVSQSETTSIHLAAALLVYIPNATLASIATQPIIDGKRVMCITYSSTHTRDAQRVIEDYQSRRLTVPLYLFNRALNMIRDRLLNQSSRPLTSLSDSA